MVKVRISVLLLKKNWKIWYIERLPTSVCAEVIHS